MDPFFDTPKTSLSSVSDNVIDITYAISTMKKLGISIDSSKILNFEYIKSFQNILPSNFNVIKEYMALGIDVDESRISDSSYMLVFKNEVLKKIGIEKYI